VVSLGERFADYGLTGGFFLLIWVALFSGFWPAEASVLLSSLMTLLPPNTTDVPVGFAPLLVSVVLSGFLLIIFFIGLLLDLVGSFFIMPQIDVFRRQLIMGKPWVQPVLASYAGFIDNDFEKLTEEFGEFKTELINAFLKFIFFWDRERWRQSAIDDRRAIQRFRLIKPFRRLNPYSSRIYGLMWSLRSWQSYPISFASAESHNRFQLACVYRRSSFTLRLAGRPLLVRWRPL
jgi:hypothetical protein